MWCNHVYMKQNLRKVSNILWNQWREELRLREPREAQLRVSALFLVLGECMCCCIIKMDHGSWMLTWVCYVSFWFRLQTPDAFNKQQVSDEHGDFKTRSFLKLNCAINEEKSLTVQGTKITQQTYRTEDNKSAVYVERGSKSYKATTQKQMHFISWAHSNIPQCQWDLKMYTQTHAYARKHTGSHFSPLLWIEMVDDASKF